MTNQLSISNILQALYEESSTVKMYVDTIAAGKHVPYTILTKSTDNEKNEGIVQRLRELLKDSEEMGNEAFTEMLRECLDEAMILEEESYKIIMFKGDAIVEGSRQIVKGGKVEQLKDYARYKGYTISVHKVED